jgi:HEAT repeat protein
MSSLLVMNSLQFAFPQVEHVSLFTSAIVIASAGAVLACLFLLAQRGIRYLRAYRLDALAFKMHKQGREIIRGDVPAEQWINDPAKCEIVQSIVIQELDAAVDKDRAGLVEFLRSNGLVDRCIQKVYDGRGWGRRRAMLALGAMRVPEAITPLAELLDDWQLDTRMTAVQSLGRTCLVEAASPIIEMLMVGALKVPATPVDNALVRCFQDNPEALLPFLRRSLGDSRELLARVAAEIATQSMADEMIVLAGDPRPEVRASAAKALAFAPLPLAIPALGDLARDEVWFVRLRATIALSQVFHPRTIPVLLEAVRDSNRLVRIRAATALAKFERETVEILKNVVDSRDRYALHSMISALELGGGFEKVMAELSDPMLHDETAARLLSAIREESTNLWSTRPADPVVESVFP